MTLKARRERILREVRAGLKETREVRGVAQAMLDEAEATERALIVARDALRKVRTPKKVPKPDVDSRRVAGPAAIAAVSEVLMRVGRTTQSEITRATGKNSGTVTHALRALEDDKLVRRTGRRDSGSDEWVWVGGVAEAVKAGREVAA